MGGGVCGLLHFDKLTKNPNLKKKKCLGGGGGGGGDGWMTCDFMSFSTVFQSYQDDGRMIMKGCVQWNPVYGWEDFASSEDQTRDR